jgi:phosphoglycolate phosphatase
MNTGNAADVVPLHLATGGTFILTSSTATAGPQAIAPVEEPQVLLREGFAWDAEPAYLFDIDGTLLRSQDRIHLTSFFSSVKSVMGRELDLDPVVLSGNTDPGILRDAFRAAELQDSEWHPVLEDILDAMRNDVLAQREAMQVRVMPGSRRRFGTCRPKARR